MARTWAAQGGGHLNRAGVTIQNSPTAWQKWPYVVFIGPSGQLAQLLPPSGFTGKTPNPNSVGAFHAHEMSLSHVNIAWKRNRLVTCWSATLATAGSMRPYAWNPEPQTESKVNPGVAFNVDTNTNIANIVVADGQNWELWNDHVDRRDFGLLFPIHDAILWKNIRENVQDHFGLYKGNIIQRQSDPTYFWPAHGGYGAVGETDDEGWSRLPGSNIPGNLVAEQEGVVWRIGTAAYPSNMSFNICDAVLHGDTFYYCTQHSVAGFTLGAKGNFIHSDFSVDTRVAQGSLTGYTERANTGQLGASPRSMAVYKDKVWMLDNNGKFFEVRPGGVIQKADLSTLGTPWSSGIFGGQIDRTSDSLDWAGATAFRPLLKSFNNQLHAFLNFRTSFNVATGKGNSASKTIGHGIFWATSHDGVNWSDRSAMLPASGIITPSGNTVQLATWLSEINPWRFSALQNTNFPSGYGSINPWGQFPPLSHGPEGQPSGFKQLGNIPFLYPDNLGLLNDTPGTAFGALAVPLTRGMLSGYLFPTRINYPSGYAFVNPSNPGTLNSDGIIIAPNILDQGSGGVWMAIGQGQKGYDYTGCSNYHIAGCVDEDDPDDKKLRLYFSRNFIDNVGDETSTLVQTLFYDLTSNSGFIQKNEAWHVGQLNGYIPIELYDPEVIIPSGTFHNPNPFVDTLNSRVKIDFIATDYGFWDSVNVRLQYSLDGGQSWANATTSGQKIGLSTSSILNDPSGLGIDANQKHTLWWLYSQDISKNTFFPRVNLRIRAEV